MITTKQEIIRASIDVIKQKGYEKASVNAIVEAAQVAKGTFYLYFEHKREIVPAIAEQLMDELLALLKGNQPVFTDLDAFISHLVKCVFDYTKQSKDLILMTYSGMALYNIFDRWETIYAPFYGYVETHLKRFNVSLPFSMALAANYVVGTLEHAAENYVLSKTRVESLLETKHAVTMFLMQALGGEHYAS